jgi:hypothetical protein
MFLKDPDATLDYSIDWSEWLDTDTIISSTWSVPEDLVAEDGSSTTTTSTVWLSGGIAGVSYSVTNQIATAGGRVDERSLSIKCVER